MLARVHIPSSERKRERGGEDRERERERERETEKESEKEVDRERERERGYSFLKGITGAWAPFSYLVIKLHNNQTLQNIF
jgi:hypothetical protein